MPISSDAPDDIILYLFYFHCYSVCTLRCKHQSGNNLQEIFSLLFNFSHAMQLHAHVHFSMSLQLQIIHHQLLFLLSQNYPLFIHTVYPEPELKFHYIVHTCLDVIEEKGVYPYYIQYILEYFPHLETSLT